MYRSDTASLGGSTSLRVGCFQFSIGTFLLSWSQQRAHSILLFVDFGPTCFMGIDTYINIYINIYEYIFLSFLHPEVA